MGCCPPGWMTERQPFPAAFTLGITLRCCWTRNRSGVMFAWVYSL